MNRTQGKLEEARFFLGELERTYYERLEEFEWLSAGSYKPPVCQYYLSAFISSARSVMWVMRNEYLRIEDWEEWYQSKELNSEDKELLKKINTVRVRSEKQAPLNLGYNVSFNDLFIEGIQYHTDESKPEWRRKRYNLKFEPVLEKGEEVSDRDRIIEFQVEVSSFFWTLEEFPDEDILVVCKSYFSFLERVLLECVSRFSRYFLNRPITPENEDVS